ncbi:calcium/calmodulin-dependent protein kinase I [Fistulifera solaris]|uniref:Calcium/calmodulin-dependent protein kinase I n=1 Tax=Fistulifera solaris TaxID=1519565 RepID=A0A1Z5K3M3_FISSO|nr:calcium/calmodulin-dependent protein kinase I [Fistulifera solaris]|eukprot:GAX20809.1 calcium/calmodulin-dependent protein kinase I [Fistulifera solaris]
MVSPISPKKKSTYVPPAPITVMSAPTKSDSTKKKSGSSKPTVTKKTSKTSAPVEDTSEGSVEPFGGNSSHSGDPLSLRDDSEDDFGEKALGRDEFEPAVPLKAAEKSKPVQQYNHATHSTPEPSSESGMRFDELYRLKGVLGTGAFSTVREGFHRSNADFSYAVKCINRKKMSEEDEAALLDEVGILKELRHAHIIRLYDFFVEPSTYYLVMERMRGGELFDRIVAKAYYNEKEARDTCLIVLQAVGYCHKNRVAHRDLKPENLLLLSEDDDTSVKIADFGFAKRVLEPNSLSTQCGTPGYVAPEILEGTLYDERADMWSVGVILYILLGGYPPFIESTQRDLFRKIRKGEYEFHEEYWGTVSSEAKDLIRNLLMVNIKKRLTAEQALKNAWILGDDAKLANRDLGVNLDKLRSFNGKRKFRAAVATVMAVNKLNSLGLAFMEKPFSHISDDGGKSN